MHGRTVAEDMAARHGEPPEWPCQFCGKFIDCCSCSFRASDVVAAMRKLEAAAPRWIPVAERLPDEDVDVLAHFAIQGLEVAAIDSLTGEWISASDVSGDEVTHWMPLPPPPAGD